MYLSIDPFYELFLVIYLHLFSNPTLLQYHFKEASTFSTRTPQSSKNVIYGWGVDVDRRKEEPIHTQYRMTGETTHVNHKRR